MIRDVLGLRRSGLATRRVAELHIPVGGVAGRDAPRRPPCGHSGAHLLVPPHLATTVDPEDQIVYAVRADPPPRVPGWSNDCCGGGDLVDKLDMPVNTVRAALHRFAHAEGARLHTLPRPAQPRGLERSTRPTPSTRSGPTPAPTHTTPRPPHPPVAGRRPPLPAVSPEAMVRIGNGRPPPPRPRRPPSSPPAAGVGPDMTAGAADADSIRGRPGIRGPLGGAGQQAGRAAVDEQVATLLDGAQALLTSRGRSWAVLAPGSRRPVQCTARRCSPAFSGWSARCCTPAAPHSPWRTRAKCCASCRTRPPRPHHQQARPTAAAA